MDALPTVGKNYSPERLGIAAVQMFAAKKGHVWRETPTADVGIDGQLEFISEAGKATGKIIAVQVKSGPSYFERNSVTGWKYYPENKHKAYWEAFPLPVIIVLHDPRSNESYWTDARSTLRGPSEKQRYIEIPRKNVLQKTSNESLFESTGLQGQEFIKTTPDVLKALISTVSTEALFPLSYFDLFSHGLTNICRSIYYGMDLVLNAVEYNLAKNGSQYGLGISSKEHEFAFGFVRFMLAQDLARIDYADCLIDWIDRKMQPHFIAPLTTRGRELVRLIHSEEERLVKTRILNEEGGLRVAQEGIFQMLPRSYYERLPRIHEFQQAIADNT